MMKKIKLGQVLDVKRGASLSGKYYSETGTLKRLTLGNFDLIGDGFKENDSKEDIFYKGPIRKEFILSKDDIITPLTEQTYGLLGCTARIPKSDLYIQSQDIGLIKCDEKELNDSYAYYLISSYIVRNQLSASSQQTKIRHTSPDKIKDCLVFLPSIGYQEKAGKILDCYTNKIALNNEIIERLNNMIKKIYVQWFYEYDFPKNETKEIIYNKTIKRNLPSTWKVENLYKNSITEIIKTGVDKFESKVYLATANIDNIDIIDGNKITFENRESRANMQPQINSVWFAKMKNSIKHISISKGNEWMVNKYILSTGFLGLKCKSNSFSYIHSFINSDYFEKVKDQLAHGATQEAVNNEDLKSVKIVIPDEETLTLYEKIVSPYIEKIYNVMQENQKLYEIRNKLIPLFINEQIVFKN